MNTNTEYEILTREIYQDLLNEEGLTTVVKHNVKIKGRSSYHQIDVYWEYTIAGITHKVAIECKNYNKELSIGKVRDFYAVLSDIGNINGIIVTKIGFQKGAKEFAGHYGIKLMVLREPQDEDWKGRIKTLVTNIEVISHYAKKWFVELDFEWAKENLDPTQLSSVEVSISGVNNEIWIYDKDGNKFKNFLQLQDQLPIPEGTNLINQKHIYEFDNIYIKSNRGESIRIKRIHIDYDTSISKSQIVFDNQKSTKAVLKDIVNGEIKFIDKSII